MSIPLIQKPEKDDINTSIIAIKRNIERINMLLGLVDTGGNEPDLSGFATKQELQDAVTELQPVDEVTVGNMHSVSSNAVARAGSYSTSEKFTGKYWYDGKPIYRKCFISNVVAYVDTVMGTIDNINFVTHLNGVIRQDVGSFVGIPYFVSSTDYSVTYIPRANGAVVGRSSASGDMFINVEYTKTTD